MSIKTLLAPHIAARILSYETLEKRRIKSERKRVNSGQDHVIEFFHDPSDPYSQLLEIVFHKLNQKYHVKLITHLVSPPNKAAAPEREMLVEYSKIDAERLARKAGIEFEFRDRPSANNTSVADMRRKKLGHYLGGMLYYGGEWYWGLDRLHYLEERLTGLGLRKDAARSEVTFPPPKVPANVGKTKAELHWYLSFRSPYTAIVSNRVKALADAYHAELKIRFVLPMVMRGLEVSPAKKKYIPMDSAREARRLHVPFGRLNDPVGRPVERGYSLIPWARKKGKEYEYVHAFLSCVWAEGTDAGSNRGIRKIVERAGLNWIEAKGIIGNEDWRNEAEANRSEMVQLGVWGVPSFRVNDTITWGQDRLWVIEEVLQRLCNTQ